LLQLSLAAQSRSVVHWPELFGTHAFCTQSSPRAHSASARHSGAGAQVPAAVHASPAAQSASVVQPPVGASQLPLSQVSPRGQSESVRHSGAGAQVPAAVHASPAAQSASVVHSS
jgi:hypothetical protein